MLFSFKYFSTIFSLYLVATLNSFGNNWLGDTGDFIINGDELQLNAPSDGSSTIYKLVSVNGKMKFTCDVNLNFNPSNNNNFELYILNSNDSNKIRFLIGENGSDDAFVYQEFINESWKTIKRIGDGEFSNGGIFNLNLLWNQDSIFTELKINNKIFLDTLFSSFKLNKSISSGVILNYTSSNTQNFTINNFIWQKWYPDTLAPYLIKSNIINHKTINLEFDESVSDFDLHKIKIGELPQDIDSVKIIDKIVTIYLNKQIQSDAKIDLEYTVLDQVLNTSSNKIKILNFYIDAKDILITEVLLNPISDIFQNESPEFIELYNSSNHDIWLNEIELIIDDKIIALPNFKLKSNKFIVINNSDQTLPYQSVKTNLPSLKNSGLEITLKANDNLIDYWEAYPNQNNKLKSEGGWSLIRESNGNCSRNKSQYSNNKKGASPGIAEWVTLSEIDSNQITSISYSELEKSVFSLTFQESLTSFQINSVELYLNNQLINDLQWEIAKHGLLLTIPNIESGKLYDTKLSLKASDCGIEKEFNYQLNLAIPSQLKKGNIQINEIMYDPLLSQNEYIEITVNNSACYFLKDIILVDKENNVINQICPLANRNELICKNNYYLITSPNHLLESEFPAIKSNTILKNVNLFPLTNEGMNLALIDKYENTLDSVTFSDERHHSSYSETKGISLEKSNSGVWQSSNWSIKGTPGKKNSAERNYLNADQDEIINCSELLVPNNNGFNDNLIIKVNELNKDYSLTIQLYNSLGEPLEFLFNNQPINSSETLTWNGQLNSGQLIPPGIYILSIQLRSSDGSYIIFKKELTVN